MNDNHVSQKKRGPKLPDSAKLLLRQLVIAGEGYLEICRRLTASGYPEITAASVSFYRRMPEVQEAIAESKARALEVAVDRRVSNLLVQEDAYAILRARFEERATKMKDAEIVLAAERLHTLAERLNLVTAEVVAIDGGLPPPPDQRVELTVKDGITPDQKSELAIALQKVVQSYVGKPSSEDG